MPPPTRIIVTGASASVVIVIGLQSLSWSLSEAVSWSLSEAVIESLASTLGVRCGRDACTSLLHFRRVRRARP